MSEITTTTFAALARSFESGKSLTASFYVYLPDAKPGEYLTIQAPRFQRNENGRRRSTVEATWFSEGRQTGRGVWHGDTEITIC